MKRLIIHELIIVLATLSSFAVVGFMRDAHMMQFHIDSYRVSAVMVTLAVFVFAGFAVEDLRGPTFIAGAASATVFLIPILSMVIAKHRYIQAIAIALAVFCAVSMIVAIAFSMLEVYIRDYELSKRKVILSLVAEFALIFAGLFTMIYLINFGPR